MHPRHYETLLLIDPDLTPEVQAEVTQKFTDIITNQHGRIVRLDNWGRRRLAYPVKKKLYGIYLLFDFMGTPELLVEFERNVRIDERIYKFLTQVLDKNFSEEKFQQELERISAEKARREAERAMPEGERLDAEGRDEDRSGDEDHPARGDWAEDDSDDDSDVRTSRQSHSADR